jgi:hypothetical protein
MDLDPAGLQVMKKHLPAAGTLDADNLKRILTLKEASDTHRRGLYKGKGLPDKLRGDYRLFRGWTDESKIKTDSRHQVRIVFAMCKAVIAELMGGIPQYRFKGRTETYNTAADVVSKYFQEQLKQARFFQTWQPATLLAILHGTGVVRKEWLRKVYTRTRPAVEIGPDLVPREAIVEIEELAYEGPKDSIVYLENFYFDPNGTDMETCAWVLEQDDRVSVRDLETYFREGVFQVDNATLSEIRRLSGGQFRYDDNPRDDYETSARSSTDCPTFRIDRYFTDEEVFYVLEEKHILNQDKEFQENPYQIRHHHRKPYIQWQFWPLPGEFYGLGVADMAGSYQFYASTAMNLELDSMRSNLTRKFVVRNGAIRSTDDLLDEQNVAILADDVDAVRDLKPISSMGAGLRIKEDVRVDAENDLGITRVLQGGRLGGSVSASEAMKVVENARKQLTVVHQNQIAALQETAEMGAAFNELFLETDTVEWEGKRLPITGELFDLSALDIEIDPLSISEDYNIQKQKEFEIFAQSLEAHIPFGHVDVLALDRGRCRVANRKPEDFLKLPGDNKPMNVPTAVAVLMAHMKDQPQPAQNPTQGTPDAARATGAQGGNAAAGNAPRPGASPAGNPIAALNTNGALSPGGISLNGANPLGVARPGPRSAVGDYSGKGLGA